MTTKAQIKLAKELMDRFFLDAEGKTDRRIDLVFTLNDMSVPFDKAEPVLDYLVSRGVIQMFDDAATLTDFGLEVMAEERDLGALPKYEREWGHGSPSAAPAPAAAAAAPTPPAAPRPKKSRVTFIDSEGQTHVIELGWHHVLGRSDEASMKLPDQRASKKHCEISFQGDHYQLKDLGSANGTLVNGNYVETHRLQHLDMVLVGRTELLFECPEVLSPPDKPREEPAKKPQPIPPMAPPEKPVVPPPKTTTVRDAPSLRDTATGTEDTIRPPTKAEAAKPPRVESARPSEARKTPTEPVRQKAPGRRPDDEATVDEVPVAQRPKRPAPPPATPPPATPARGKSAASGPVKVVKGEPAKPPSHGKRPGKTGDLFAEEPEEAAPSLFAGDTVPERDDGGEDLFVAPSRREDLVERDRGPAKAESSVLFGGGTAEVEEVDLFADTGDLQRGTAESEPADLPPATESELITLSGPTPARSEVPLKSSDLLDIPEAPEQWEESAPTQARPSEFDHTLGQLRKRVESAALPDRADLLDAIELLRRHPFVRATLAQLER